MNQHRISAGVSLALLISACGSKTQDGADGNATASTVPTKPKVDCSAVKPQTAGQGQAPDDIVGLRAGMSLASARDVLICENSGFRLSEPGGGFGGIPNMPDGKSVTSVVLAQAGKIAGCDPNDPKTLERCVDENPDFERVDEKVIINSTGLPGQEKVYGVTRTIVFPEGKERPIADLEAELIRKYGDPAKKDDASADKRLAWVYETSGRPMSPANPAFDQCVSNNGYESSGPGSVGEGCGLVITAWLSSKSANPALADRFVVMSMRPEDLYHALDQTKQQVNAAIAAKQASDVQKARASGGGTKL